MRSWEKKRVVERFLRKYRVKRESESERRREVASLSLYAENNRK